MENEKSNKYAQKAFTLTELLIVVVVVGVLAAVAMPKFNRVIETRRTVEAEELISAVRTEQEKRCTFDKPYAESFAKLPGVISVNNPDKNKTRTASQNYTYYLDNSGMYASSRNKDYQIKMQSYAAGGLCCEGAYCSSLNKSYPPCGAVPIDGCAAEIPGCQNPVYAGKPENACECDPNSCHCRSFASSNPCVCGKECSAGDVATQACTSGCGTQKRSCNSSCRWLANWDTSGCSSPSGPSCSCSDVGKCGSASGSASCDGGRCDYSSCTTCCSGCYGTDNDSQTCNDCGTQYRYRSCNCDTWSGWGGWGPCSKTVAECTLTPDCTDGTVRGSQSCNSCGTQTTQKCVSGKWTSSLGTCSKTAEECEPKPDCTEGATQGSQGCNSCGTQTTQKCVSGKWTSSLGTCSKTAEECEPSCVGDACCKGTKPGSSCGNCGTQAVTCNTKTGVWETGTCERQGVCKPGATKVLERCSAICYTNITCAKEATEVCTSRCEWGEGASCYTGPWWCCINSNGVSRPATSTIKCPTGFSGPSTHSDPFCGEGPLL